MLEKLLKDALRQILATAYAPSFWRDLGEVTAALAELQRQAPNANLKDQRLRSDSVNHMAIKLQNALFFGLLNTASERRYLQMVAEVEKNATLRSDGVAFHELFQPKQNDVIYGCWEGRIIYTCLYATPSQAVAIDHQRFVKTDTFNDASWRTPSFAKSVVSGSGKDLLADVVREKIREAFKQQKEVLTPGDVDKAERYFVGFNEHPRYAPTRLAKSSLSEDERQKLEKRELKPSERQMTDEEARFLLAAYNRLTRRACKFGIEHALSQGRNVHFILDGLFADLEQFNRKLDPNHERVPITVSELTFVARFHLELTALHKGKVFFYVGGKTIAAPWMTESYESFKTDEWRRFTMFFGAYALKRAMRAKL